MSKIAQCTQKLRLFYYELYVLKSELHIVINLSKFYPTDKTVGLLVRSLIYFNNGQKTFKVLQHKIDTQDTTAKELDEIDIILEQNLKKLSYFRTKVFSYFTNIIFKSNKETKFLFLIFQKHTDYIYKFFRKHINDSSFDLTHEKINDFINYADSLTKTITNANNIDLTKIKNSQQIFEKLKLYCSLKLWSIKLSEFEKDPSCQLSIDFIQNISNIKYLFFKNITNTNHNSIFIQELINLISDRQNILLSYQVIELLADQTDQLRESINESEILLANTIKSKSYFQKSFNLFRQSFHYKLAENYINITNNFTQEKLANVPILNSQLNQSFIKFFSLVLASFMIGSELYNKSWFGMPHNIISTTADLLLNYNFINKIYIALMSHELTSACHMKYLKQAIQFILSFALFALTTDFTSRSTLVFVGGYFFAIGTQLLFNHTFNNLTTNKNNAPQHTLGFLSYLVQLLGLAAGNFLWQQVLKTNKYFLGSENKENILSNKEKCLTYPKECREEALKVLQLEDKQVDLKIIHQQYRLLAKSYHPDKTKEYQDSNRFFKLAEAKTRLVDLYTQNQLPIFSDPQSHAEAKKFSLN